MVMQNSVRFWEFLAKPPNEAILDLRGPQNGTRDHDYCEGIENQRICYIFEPFGEDFLPNRAKSDPTNLGEPRRGLCFVSSELQNVVLFGTFVRRTHCNFPTISTERRLMRIPL